MKSNHSQHNNFSIAQFVRRCIYFVLLGLEKYGTLDEFRRVLEELKCKHGENLASRICAKSVMITNYLEIIRQLEETCVFEMWIVADWMATFIGICIFFMKMKKHLTFYKKSDNLSK